MSKHKNRQKEKFQIEFGNITDAIAGNLLNTTTDLSEGIIVEYNIDNLSALAQVLKKKLPSVPRVKLSHIKIPKENILLWHGTSLTRAKSILESGFSTGKQGVFFSTNILTSCGAAEGRASNEHSEPAIFIAHYDFSTLEFNKQFQVEDHFIETHYIFHSGIASQIVRYLLTCHGLYSTGKIVSETKKFRDDLTCISITGSSGNAGIAYWLNSFLDLDDSQCISENDPIVWHIKAWVDAQYNNGRTLPITDEEILNLVKNCLPNFSS